jgi:hypothetical protein
MARHNLACISRGVKFIPFCIGNNRPYCIFIGDLFSFIHAEIIGLFQQ